MCSGNQVGVEGARALGDALKVNSTLTTLYLNGMLQYVACVMHVCVLPSVDHIVPDCFWIRVRHQD